MKKAISVILSIVLFFLFGLITIFCSFNRVSSVDFVTDAVKDIDVADTLNSLRENSSEVDNAINDLYEQAEKNGYSKDQVDAIINSDTTKSLVETYAESILGDGKDLTNEDISKIITNNATDIIEKSNGKLTKDDKGKIIEAGEALAPSITENLPTKKEIQKMVGKENMNNITNPIKSGFSIIVIIVTIVIIGLLIYLQRKKFKWLIYTGVPLLVSSSFTVVFAVLFKAIASLAAGEEDVSLVVATPIIKTFADILLIIGIIGILIFIVEIVVYFILKKKIVKKKELA